jgi:alpha-beta hydrolase superfamily lysophospholipase
MKIVFRWLKVVIIVYCSIGIALFYLQDKILFHPASMKKEEKFSFPLPHREINIPYDAQTTLNIIQFLPADDTAVKGVVLYFHGNHRNISWYAEQAPEFTKKNYEVWMLDYPGFGKSTGLFTEQRLYDYALQFYKLARTKYSPSQIVIYGKSLGTGIAAELASVRDCKYLLLESPYYSMTSLVRHYLPIYPVGHMLHYHFPAYQYIEKVTAPVVIFQGTRDGIVPYSNASMLKPLLKPGDAFESIEGGTHNDLTEFSLYRQKLDSLLSR